MDSLISRHTQKQTGKWVLPVIVLLFELALMGLMLFVETKMVLYVAAVLLVPILVAFTPIEPTIGIVCMIIVTGLDFLGSIADVGSRYKLTFFHLFFMLTLFSSVTNSLIRNKFKIPAVNIWGPLIAFFTMYGVSLVYTPDIESGLVQFSRVSSLSLLIGILLLVIDRYWKLNWVIAFFMIVPAAISVVTLYQLFAQGDFYSATVIRIATVVGLPVYRSTGTFNNPNILACFLMIGVVMSFALLFLKNVPLWVWILVFLSGMINTLGLLSTFSRGGWLSTICALSVVIIFHRKWSYFWYGVLFLLLCLSVVTLKAPELWEVVFERVGSIFNPSEDASSSGRLALIYSSIAMWLDHPFFGVGLRGFSVTYQDYVSPDIPEVLAHQLESHTIQTEILAEFGLVGLTIAFWLLMTILFHGIRSIRTMNNSSLQNIQIGFVSLFIGFFVNFAFASDIINNMFWMTIGLIYVVPALDKSLSSNQITANTHT